MGLRENLIVVVHQIRSPDNLGAIARLMANFALPELILSEPNTWHFDEAARVGVGGDRILENFTVVPDLATAVSGAVYAIGTTMRTLDGRPPLTPEEGIARLAHHAQRGRVALVFGGERRGLSDADLAHCQEYVAIPTSAEQPSMNLAQSAAVLLYLCSRVERPATAAPTREGARLGTVRALEASMRQVLLDAGFLNPQAPDHILGELERSLLRGELTQREAELWLTAFKQLARMTKRG